MSTYKIPLRSDDRYNMIMNLGTFGDVKLQFSWNDITKYWVMGITYTNDEPILYGQTLIPNVNLLKGWYNLSKLQGELYLFDDGDDIYAERIPTLDNVSDFNLYYIEE